MQVKCPKCKTLLEIPSEVMEYSSLPIECGACSNQFTLQLNRPSLKVRNRNGVLVSAPSEDVVIISESLDEEVDAIILTELDSVEGWVLGETLGRITAFSPLSSVGEERDAAYLSVVARAQSDLRGQARVLGANAVISVRMDSVGNEEAAALRLSGVAVRLTNT